MNIAQPLASSKNPSKREQAIAATIALLAELYPKCFSIYQERRRPLKAGIHVDIQAALDGAITPGELRQVLGYYCSNPAYLSHLRTGVERFDLNGEPAGAVTDDEETHARAMLASIKAKKEARAAAANAQAPPANKRLSLADLKAAALKRRQSCSK
jgi:ProP effector